MSTLSFGSLIERAGIQVGDNTLTAEARFWLNDWLRKAYLSWPWPFLIKRASGVALAAGTQVLTLGSGSEAVITGEIIRVRDPIILYSSDYTQRTEARVQTLTGNNVSTDEAGRNPATYLGRPRSFKVRPNWTGAVLKKDFIPLPFPDRAYLLAFDYFEMPADFDTSASGDDDNTPPVYPNDRTIIQAMKAEMMRNKDGPSAAYQSELKLAAEMLAADQMRLGSELGVNQSIDLDGSVFT